MSYLDSDEALLRFERQISLPAFNYEGQHALSSAHALIIGAGGLGCASAQSLAAAGLGNITIVDGDSIELSNLPRQTAFRADDIGQFKADILAQQCRSLNPYISVKTICENFDPSIASDAFSVVLDCTDNFDVRYQINQFAIERNHPLVSGAAIQFDGQLCVFDPRNEQSACYACLYPPDSNNDSAQQTCTDNGVIAPIVSIIGQMQALEAIKIVANCGTPIHNKLLLISGLTLDIRTLTLQKDPSCSVCSQRVIR